MKKQATKAKTDSSARVACARLRALALFISTFLLTFSIALTYDASAAGGDVNDPDLEVQGFTLFGTNTAGATTVTSGWGNVYIDNSLEINSNLVVNGKVTSTDTLQISRYGLVQGVQILTGLVAIEPTSSYIRVQGNAVNVDILANPQISAGYPGQMLTLQGTANDRLVQIDDGDGVQTQMDQPFSLGEYDTLQLIYDDGTANWVEINRSNNRSSN